MTTKNFAGSKTELLRAVQKVTYKESVSQQEKRKQASKDYQIADKAVQKFKKTNSTYKALIKSRDKAYNEMQSVGNEIRNKFRDEARKITNLIYVEGPTPETVKKVAAFLKKYDAL